VTDIDDDYDEPDDDRYDEYKDDLAMGRIYPDGTQRDPDETAYLEAEAAHEYELHCAEVHGGSNCDCPRPALEPGEYSDEPPF
jgi:hypothetical protein